MILQTELGPEHIDQPTGDAEQQRPGGPHKPRVDTSEGPYYVTTLTEQQAQALDGYAALQRSHPQLFEGRPRRPIVTDLEAMRTYAAQHGVVLGVLAQTPYLWLVNDLVEITVKSGGYRYPYLRLIPPPHLQAVDGVVVLATTTGEDGTDKIALLRIDRHATGTTELELPRGFGSAGSSGTADAERELAEETGLRGDQVRYLGRTLTDTGTTSGAASFFHIRVSSMQDAMPEAEESIERIILMTRDQMWASIDSGELRDSFTIQALALYERWLILERRPA